MSVRARSLTFGIRSRAAPITFMGFMPLTAICSGRIPQSLGAAPNWRRIALPSAPRITSPRSATRADYPACMKGTWTGGRRNNRMPSVLAREQFGLTLRPTHLLSLQGGGREMPLLFSETLLRGG